MENKKKLKAVWLEPELASIFEGAKFSQWVRKKIEESIKSGEFVVVQTENQ